MQSKAVVHLLKADPILGEVIKRLSPLEWNLETNYFKSLVEAIISQQLSEKAATTITNRFIALFPKGTFPKPKHILKLSDEVLRTAGISFSKIAYIKDLSQKIEQDAINFDSFKDMKDEEITTELVKVKGIGRWTAEMFLMFSLGRPDVFSYGDLGLRNGLQKVYKLKKPPTPQQAKKITNKWKPYRTWGSRYLWRSLELD